MTFDGFINCAFCRHKEFRGLTQVKDTETERTIELVALSCTKCGKINRLPKAIDITESADQRMQTTKLQ